MGQGMDQEAPQEPAPEREEIDGRIRGVYLRVRGQRTFMEALKSACAILVRRAMALAFASFQIWMNPRLLRSGAALFPGRRRSSDHRSLFYGTEGRDAVSVASRRGHAAHATGPVAWKYGDHARALDALLQYHPKAVVVDICLSTRAPTTHCPI